MAARGQNLTDSPEILEKSELTARGREREHPRAQGTFKRERLVVVPARQGSMGKCPATLTGDPNTYSSSGLMRKRETEAYNQTQVLAGVLVSCGYSNNDHRLALRQQKFILSQL